MDKLTEFHKECIRNCVNHKIAVSYRSKYRELSDLDVIKQCRLNAGHTDNKIFTLSDYCKAAGVDIKCVKEFMDDVTADLGDKEPESLLRMGLADWVIGYINSERNQNIETICKALQERGYDVSVPRFKGIQRRYPEWTKDEIAGYCMLHEPKHTNKIYYITVDNHKYTLSELCSKVELNYDTIRSKCITNGELDINKLLMCTNRLTTNWLGDIISTNLDNKHEEIKDTTLKEKCSMAGVNYKTVIQFKYRHPNISDELAIKAVSSTDKLTAKEKCEIAGVNYKAVMHYKNADKSRTLEQNIRYIKKKEKINESER